MFPILKLKSMSDIVLSKVLGVNFQSKQEKILSYSNFIIFSEINSIHPLQ